MKFTLKDFQLPAGDVTFFVEMEAVEPLEGFTKEDRVPRAVYLRLSKTPSYGEGRYDSAYTDLNGYIGTHGYTTNAFYFRRPKTGAEKVEVTIEVEGRGRANLRAITAHNAVDIVAREFDRGLVVVNPSLEPVTVTASKLFPQRSGLPATITVPALDAQFTR